MSARSIRFAGLASAIVVAATLSSCGAQTTCNDYAGKSITERTTELQTLLRSHGLDQNDAGNIGGVTRAVENYCHPSKLSGGVADSNGSQPLDNAADWKASTWAP